MVAEYLHAALRLRCFPTGFDNLSQAQCRLAPSPFTSAEAPRENHMAVDAVASRLEITDRREPVREALQQIAAQRPDARRDQRVEETQPAAAARPSQSERAAEQPARQSSGARMLDILV